MVLPVFGGWVEFALSRGERAFFEVGAVVEDAARAFFGGLIRIFGFLALVLVLAGIVFWLRFFTVRAVFFFAFLVTLFAGCF
jgi:hypothetical protein